MKNGRFVKIFFTISILIVFSYFAYQFAIKFNSEIDDIKIVHWVYIIPIILLTFATSLLNGLMSKVLWHDQGLDLKVKEWYGLTILNTFLNYIVPFRGGTFTIATLMKKRYKFSVTSFISTLSASYVVIFWLNSLGALVALVWLNYSKSITSPTLGIFFTLSFIFFSSILIFSPSFNETGNRYIDRFIGVINSWHEMRNNYRLQLKVAGIAFLNIFITAAIIYFQFKVLGFEINYANSLILSVMSSFALMVSITPANIGVREGLFAFTGIALGIPLLQTVLIGILDRLIGFTFVFLLVPIFLKSLGLVKDPKKWLSDLMK